MKTLEIDREGAAFVVSWFTINGTKKRRFDTRTEASTFAIAKMGKTGCIIDSCDLTPEQRSAKEALEARARQIMQGGVA